MPIQANSLNIYVHSDDEERLVRDGITVLLPDKDSADKHAEARRLVQESHTVLICISRQFNKAGNVFEWVSSLYVPYPYNSLDGREVLSASGSRILRGGSWANSADGIASFYRLDVDPRQYAVAGNDVGFRCARDANP